MLADMEPHPAPTGPPAGVDKPTPVMDVVAAPPPESPRSPETPDTPPKPAEPDKTHDKPPKPAPPPKPPKPPKQPGSGVGLAITATMIIVLGLAALATYAYIQTHK